MKKLGLIPFLVIMFVLGVELRYALAPKARGAATRREASVRPEAAGVPLVAPVRTRVQRATPLPWMVGVPDATAAVAAQAPPRSLSEVTLTPAMQARLAEISPNARDFIDHRLALLVLLEECIGDRLSSDGSIDVFLHFSIDEVGKSGIGSGFTLLDSTLTPDDDGVISECLTREHGRLPLALKTPIASSEYHLPTRITFPLKYDWARRFARGETL